MTTLRGQGWQTLTRACSTIAMIAAHSGFQNG